MEQSVNNPLGKYPLAKALIVVPDFIEEWVYQEVFHFIFSVNEIHGRGFFIFKIKYRIP